MPEKEASPHVVLALPSLGSESGGPPRSVSALAAHLCHEGLAIDIMAATNPVDPDVEIDQRIHRLAVQGGGLSLKARMNVPDYRPVLEARHREAPLQLVHQNGLWLKSAHQTCQFARSHDIPLILSPRGMLDIWAMGFHGWKKRLAWWLFQRKDCHQAAAFHATAEEEAARLRELGFRQPVIVLPNGVDPVPEAPAEPAAVAEPKPRKNAFFLSRVHPKKGIPLLLEAWARLKPADWELIVAGNDCDGHTEELRRQAERLGIGSDVSFPGPLFGAAKDTAFRRADLFVLPTYSENFGIVVAEALGYATPVITTHGTPWGELPRTRCGWHVPVSAEGIYAALREAFAQTDEERRAFGERGRSLVEGHYQWPGIAAQMANAYRWLLGTGERPVCVH